jgi:hypothetical protein
MRKVSIFPLSIKYYGIYTPKGVDTDTLILIADN